MINEFNNKNVIAVIIFFLFNLIIGVFFRKKVKNIEDYALGGRKFNSLSIIATLVATWVSGSMFSIVIQRTYIDGFYYIISSIGVIVGTMILAYIFVPKMDHFLGKLSVAEIMGDIYGEKVRVVTAISGLIASVGFIAAQFRIIGDIFSMFLNVSDSSYIIIISSFIVTLYCVIGGIRSVVFTDVFQFIIFSLMIIIMYLKFYTDSSMQSVNPLNFFANFTIEQHKLWPALLLTCYYCFPDLRPVIFQRITMAKSISQIRSSLLISAVIILLIKLSLIFIAIQLKNILPNLSISEILPYAINYYCPAGFTSIVLIGVTAMAISTIDSIINSSSVLFSHDLCTPLNLWNKKQLLVSRIFSIVISISSVIVAIFTKDLLGIILSTSSFYIPIVSVPLIYTILGYRLSNTCILWVMFCGFCAVIISKLCINESTNGVIPGAIFNAVLFFMLYLYKTKFSNMGNK